MFSCNLPPALLAKWLGRFTCYWDIKLRVGTESWSWRRKLTCCSCLEPTAFWSQVWCCTTKLSSLSAAWPHGFVLISLRLVYPVFVISLNSLPPTATFFPIKQERLCKTIFGARTHRLSLHKGQQAQCCGDWCPRCPWAGSPNRTNRLCWLSNSYDCGLHPSITTDLLSSVDMHH